MSFPFRIRFGGLMAFVSRPDGKKAWAFLVEARRIFDEPGKEVIPSHLAVARFDLGNLVAAQGFPNPGAGVWFMDGFDLRILPGGQPSQDSLKLVEFDLLEPDPELDFSDPAHPKPGRSSFAWVAPLRRSVPERPDDSRIRPEFLDDKLSAQDAALLAARVHLNQGELGTSAFSTDSLGDTVVYRFGEAKAATTHRQVFAAEVSLEMTVDSDFVELRGEKFNGTGSSSVKLAPPPGHGDSRVEVSIMNEECDQILGAPKHAEILHVGKLRPQDRLFEEFFRLTKSGVVPSALSLPVLDQLIRPNLPAAGGIAVGSPPCSPAHM